MSNSKYAKWQTLAEGYQILSMPNSKTSVEGLCFYIYIYIDYRLVFWEEIRIEMAFDRCLYAKCYPMNRTLCNHSTRW